MPAYATSAQFATRDGSRHLVRVSDRDGDGVADTPAVDAALLDAASIMNGIVGRRFQVPLVAPNIPDWFIRCNVEIAAALMAFESRGANTKTLMMRHDYWIKRLDMVANGMMSLGLGANEPDTNFEADIESDTPVLDVGSTAGII